MTPQLNAIGLVTTDLAASLRFYRLLGLDIPEDVESRPHVDVVAGGVRLMWDTVEVVESFGGPYTPPTGDARVSLAFECDGPGEVDAVWSRLAEAGHGEVEPFDAPWGQRYATVTDPDGNGVDLFAALPS
ncbi:VOC family protein [Prescottella equi]|uniref:VOC family protein n=1 Tax=Rhodococcus hoagii TaxID=43767 RepID=UPI0007CD5DBC|nr:VOC family protein [Prescottella equi]GBF15608.1 glyoxalase-like domain protein [Rhodococcus sp. Br-6]MBM4520260.1 glyoxalase [Prescottella equi]MBM4531664.1 glyoxalase [Prescottella equi]MBM4547472.1 glyoxalase [Prescottella equi]MBM4574292.1 glyoxalase [Prescottella equi]